MTNSNYSNRNYSDIDIFREKKKSEIKIKEDDTSKIDSHLHSSDGFRYTILISSKTDFTRRKETKNKDANEEKKFHKRWTLISFMRVNFIPLIINS